jgi:hypothetical protein
MTADLALELERHHVPSIGPQTGLLLVRIRDAIRNIPENERSDDMTAYLAALDFVAWTAAHHQAIVIAIFERLVAEAKG